jgi:hypothetical protein
MSNWLYFILWYFGLSLVISLLWILPNWYSKK